MSGGIVAQYGFLYQKGVYIKSILDNHSTNVIFKYEGIDDIDLKSINYKVNNKDIFIQVKSGTLTKKDFLKVIGNWLNIDSNSYSCYKLILEKELEFDQDIPSLTREIIKEIKKGENQRKNAIFRKVYDKFKEEDDDKVLENLIHNILSSYEKEVISLEELKKNIEETFHASYGKEVDYIISKKRNERFYDYINREIEKSTEKKETCKLKYADIQNILLKVVSEISEKKYEVFDLTELKKRLEPQAKKIIETNLKEVKELRMVTSNENRILKALINKLLYEDFRNTYSSEYFMSKIKNIEAEAKENYEDTLEELEDEGILTSKELYNKTIIKEIKNELFPKTGFHLKGCYVYLTGDEAPEEFKITWEV